MMIIKLHKFKFTWSLNHQLFTIFGLIFYTNHLFHLLTINIKIKYKKKIVINNVYSIVIT